ncbi:MAG: ATP-binding cassette domain-containing protein [Burkholderiaceae bacterium]|nr:MAG: ATP-binding cassette domain-containing protein [Burkholderiaceae bacterium]
MVVQTCLNFEMTKKEQPKKNEYIDNLKNSHRRYFLGALILSPMIAFLPIAPIAYMRTVFGPVINSDSLSYLTALACLLIFALIICGILEYIREKILLAGAISFISKLEDKVYDVTLVGPKADWADGQKMLNHLRSMRYFLKSPIVGAFFDAPFSLILLLAIFFIHPLMGIFSLLGALIAFLTGLYIEKKIEPDTQLSFEAQSTSRLYLNSFFQNIYSCASMGNLRFFYDKWKNVHKKHLLYQSKTASVQAFGSALSQNVMMIQGSMVLGVGAMLMLTGALPAYMAGNLIIAKFIGALAIRPSMMIIMSWPQVIQFRFSYSELKNLLLDYEKPRENNLSLPPPKGFLKVMGVRKTSDSSKKIILSNINFTAGPKSITAVMGESGAGKTTLAKLLVGIDSPTNGVIRLDDVEIFKWKKIELGPNIGYLPQNIELFGGSLMDNVSRFNPINDKFLQQACELAGIRELFDSHKAGNVISIDHDTLSISNGMKQKVGLARALYGNPKFLVLDEPTSKLDAPSEAKFLEAIQIIKEQGACIIIITHNTKVIQKADTLLMINNGEQKLFDSRENAFARIKAIYEKNKST